MIEVLLIGLTLALFFYLFVSSIIGGGLKIILNKKNIIQREDAEQKNPLLLDCVKPRYINISTDNSFQNEFPNKIYSDVIEGIPIINEDIVDLDIRVEFVKFCDLFLREVTLINQDKDQMIESESLVELFKFSKSSATIWEIQALVDSFKNIILNDKMKQDQRKLQYIVYSIMSLSEGNDIVRSKIIQVLYAEISKQKAYDHMLEFLLKTCLPKGATFSTYQELNDHTALLAEKKNKRKK